MVQDPTSLASFFNQFAQENHIRQAEWGEAYREITQRVQREKPDFSEQTLRDLWYTRDNKVSSLRQGGMSHDEFVQSEADLRALTQLVSSGCSVEIFKQVHQRLHELKAQGKLKKFYRALCSRVFATFYPEQITSIINEGIFFHVYNYCNNHFQLGLPENDEWTSDNWFTLNQRLKKELRSTPGLELDDIAMNMSLWLLYELELEDVNEGSSESAQPEADGDDQSADSRDILPPKNLILYGPPGTGKTYNTVEIAVKACEPQAYIRLDGKDPAERRQQLKQMYDALIEEKRIRFVTFHQSFGYEEFIEGLRAETAENGSVRYDIKPGIFRQICEDAAIGNATVQIAFDDALEQFKTQCLEQDEVILNTINGKPFRVAYTNNSTFDIYPQQSKKGSLEKGYSASIENIRRLYHGETERFYNISYVRGILNYLLETWHLPAQPNSASMQKKQNYVLIIDEINRGNISKIFGELITLIETSKRAGESESLSVTLPYSGKPFSVPNNLFLVGTMNTADRSLTAIDTALRRRFEFKQMLPDERVLRDVVIEGINLEKLFTTLNARIQTLYDSEHTLGHAFFIPVARLKEDPAAAFKELQRVMKNKVLPLLEEYFYNDWQKIRLVLGDNQKNDQSLHFVRPFEQQNDLSALFGVSAIDDLQEAGVSYQLSPDTDKVWETALAYRQIYEPKAETIGRDS